MNFILMVLTAMLILPLSNAHGVSEKEKASQPPIPIQPISQNIIDPESFSRYGLPYSVWEIPGATVLEGVFRCDIKEILGVWPTLSCRGYITQSFSDKDIKQRHLKEIEALNKKNSNDLQFVELYLLESTHRKELSELNEASRKARMEKNYSLFEQLYVPNPIVRLDNGYRYELIDFQGITRSAAEKIEAAANESVKHERLVISGTILGLFIGAIIAIVLIRKIIRLANTVAIPFAKRRFSVAQNKVRNASAAMRSARDERIFRKAVIDEAAREVTRRAFSATEHDDRNRLIKDAIDAAIRDGDEVLADALRKRLMGK